MKIYIFLQNLKKKFLDKIICKIRIWKLFWCVNANYYAIVAFVRTKFTQMHIHICIPIFYEYLNVSYRDGGAQENFDLLFQLQNKLQASIVKLLKIYIM